ncbi:MAG TPA: HAD family hydrolase [Bacteroidales bacterium]|nr:MAG: HAD family hydrolase [Bacteroidetes bacterium GWE2_42_24]OFY29204.1 MAG: HAD family hydrolase [Bacteroidetes bacterium GWF2_43_11]HAQ65511.1 HAD family hydrolase [Bacteroidales bacterium]HBZ66813.1 HAD family hydrolase [Bacteroidales bacterium]
MTNSKVIKVIAFDADDTLWVNEPYYQEAEHTFKKWMSEFTDPGLVSEQLFTTEIRNLPMYGYGAKGYTLSMIETAIHLSQGLVSAGRITDIIRLGQSLVDRQIELLHGVETVLPILKPHYTLVLATKGDLLDQERKLERSGLNEWFHHIEIMSNKREEDYRRLLDRLGIGSKEFLMVGNSLKSDVLPVQAIGGHAVWIPYHTTWQYEEIQSGHPHGYTELHDLDQLPALLGL